MHLHLPHLPSVSFGAPTRRPAATLREALAPPAAPWGKTLRRIVRRRRALGFAVAALGAVLAAVVITWSMHPSVAGADEAMVMLSHGSPLAALTPVYEALDAFADAKRAARVFELPPQF